jgi:hypothetical protein
VLVAAALLSWTALAPAQTGSTVFPKGSRLGLAPPAGMTQSQSFPGFEAANKAGALILLELPGPAFVELEKAMTAEALGREGFKVETRKPFTIKDGQAVLAVGQQEVSGNQFRKWLLLASTGDVTALVTVQIPAANTKNFSDATIENALATLALRPQPVEEQLSLLPFKVGDLAGFKVTRLTGQTAVLLTDGPDEETTTGKQLQFVAAVAPGGPAQPGERGDFARRSVATMPGFKEMRITSAEPIRLNNQPGFEVRAEAKNARSDLDVSIVQWIRFGSGGYLRMVGVSPRTEWDRTYPRFRAIRDGITPR